MGRFALVCDLDGTLLPRPYGVPPIAPPLSHGPAYQPLLELLELGAMVVGVTGSSLDTHRK
eukprot:6212242-Pleurochrysis_carterae.AAC.3